MLKAGAKPDTEEAYENKKGQYGYLEERKSHQDNMGNLTLAFDSGISLFSAYMGSRVPERALHALTIYEGTDSDDITRLQMRWHDLSNGVAIVAYSSII